MSTEFLFLQKNNCNVNINCNANRNINYNVNLNINLNVNCYLEVSKVVAEPGSTLFTTSVEGDT